MPERRANQALVEFIDSLATIREEIEDLNLADKSERWRAIHNIATFVSTAIGQNHAYGLSEHLKKFDPSKYPDDGELAWVEPDKN